MLRTRQDISPPRRKNASLRARRSSPPPPREPPSSGPTSFRRCWFPPSCSGCWTSPGRCSTSRSTPSSFSPVCLGRRRSGARFHRRYARARAAGWTRLAASRAGSTGCASLLLCGYITVRYEALTYELAMLPVEGIIGSAILTFLVLDASRRISGWGFVGIILAMAVYVYISPFLPGDFQTRWVSPRAHGRLCRPRRERHDRLDPGRSRCWS